MESVWHPEYQRYCEHVFNHLIRVALTVLSDSKGKDYVSPPLRNGVERLREFGLASLCVGYDAVVRNSISHGSVLFGLFQIEYKDGAQSKPQELSPDELVRLVDDLVDTCHSLLIAIVLFVARNRQSVEAEGLNRVCLGLRYLLLDSIVSHEGFMVEYLVESTAIRNRRQLNIVCHIKSRVRQTQLYEAVIASCRAVQCGGDVYNRISVSLDCGIGVSPHVFLNGDRLQLAIKNNETLEQCSGELVENSLLWTDAPHVWGRVYSFWSALVPLARDLDRRIRTDWETRGIIRASSYYEIRNVRNKSVSGIARCEALVILKLREGVLHVSLQEILVSIVYKLRRHLFRDQDLMGARGIPRSPTYIWIRLYAEDKRIRALRRSGWRDPNLILHAEWAGPKTGLPSVFVKTPDVIFDHMAVQFSPLWLSKPT